MLPIGEHAGGNHRLSNMIFHICITIALARKDATSYPHDYSILNLVSSIHLFLKITLCAAA